MTNLVKAVPSLRPLKLVTPLALDAGGLLPGSLQF